MQDLSKLTVEELTAKILELNGKTLIAPPHLHIQLAGWIELYQKELEVRNNQ